MPEPIISVENLSKRYLIGHRREPSGSHGVLDIRDVVTDWLYHAKRRASDFCRSRQIVHGNTVEEFWALRDLSFGIQKGEVLGIIGRNGAGKSTLLKVLSRITEPTSGRVTLRGRVASLLEVGTGFHPELTGRENIYLNGAILGMSRAEIRAKFNEIVAFADVEKFLDTPVKRYSSGMYVRLAFAVAANLEPEILIVDEVLAVGDNEFQRKCLGKMDEISRREGRTVVFVSHNMEAVLRLCSRCILLERGRIAEIGQTDEVISRYLATNYSNPIQVPLADKPRPYGSKSIRLIRACLIAPRQTWSFPFGERLSFDLWIDSDRATDSAELGIGLFSVKGYEIASWTNACSGDRLAIRAGLNMFRIEYENLLLLPGHYVLGFGLRSTQGGVLEDYLPDALPFEIAVSSRSAEINARSFGGALVPDIGVIKIQMEPAAPGLATAV